MTTAQRAQIVSVGTAVPDRIVSNKDLERFLDTSDEWIVSRTGIRQRHLGPEDQSLHAYELGARAAAVALERAGMKAGEIDGIVCATFTPDFFFPSTACKIQHVLGARKAFAFDLSAACAGFVYGLTVANSMIASGQCRSMLLIGAEIISRTLDWTDRSTCILFGDAAGAVVLRAANGADNAGVLSAALASDGSLARILYLPAWGENRRMKMNGGEVFKHAVRLMSDHTKAVLSSAGLSVDELDLLIPHQANIRIINAIAEHLGVPPEKIVTNVERYGNTSSASIPLALEEAWNGGRVKAGTVAAFTSLGGGVTLASAAVRF